MQNSRARCALRAHAARCARARRALRARYARCARASSPCKGERPLGARAKLARALRARCAQRALRARLLALQRGANLAPRARSARAPACEAQSCCAHPPTALQIQATRLRIQATRTGRTPSTHLRPFAKQSGATCVPQRPLTSFPPSFRAVTRKHLGARRGRPPGRPRGVKRCPKGENAPF